MSSTWKKIQKNAARYELDQIYKNMTPEQYKEGINLAVKKATEKVAKEYESELFRLQDRCNTAIRESVIVAMDTIAVEMLYELGETLKCFEEEPEYLDQKIEIVQNIYETAMTSIENYASAKYKNDKQAQKEFKRKKSLIRKIFNIYGNSN